jgi:iron complex outermembrane receptor protein
MLNRTRLAKSLMIAFGGTAICGATAFAQSTPDTPPAQELQRVEITGSSIKRVDAESALPVTVITRQDIERSGVTSVTDLIQALPSMQGFLTASSSVNGGGGGATNASLHAIGSQYTLVLLNGRRLAPYNTGTTVNLESIPLAAIDRVEVLTDGASAIYGADAIAGVVNFVLRKDATDGVITATGNVPQKSGGASYNFSATKGFGDIDKDKFNVLLSFGYDKQQELAATQRDFSKSGVIPFTYGGQNLVTQFLSANSVPANVFISTTSGDNGAFFSPNLLKTGKCATGQYSIGGACYYDYSANVDDIPESERTSLFGSGRLKVSDNLTLFSEVALSRFENSPRYAPPAQPNIPLTSGLYTKDVAPYLSQLGFTPAQIADTNAGDGSMYLRLADAGQRADRYRTDTVHIVLGAEGSLAGWDLSTYYTHSQNKATDFALSGYTSKNFFFNVIDSGAFDPLTSAPGTATSVLAPGVLHQVLDSSLSSIDVVSLKGSRPVMTLPAGDVAVGLGAEYMKQRYKDDPSAILQGPNALQPTFTDTIIGGGGGALPFDSTRNSTGIFGELVVPVVKELEVSGALRYDNYGAVSNSKNFDSNGNPIGSATQGTSASSTTYKISFRFQPTHDLLFRGSYGTGFKAPGLSDITSPLQAAGVTSGQYACPFTPAQNAAFAAACPAGKTPQYNEQSGGNPLTGDGALKPEKSKQWSLGFRYEPAPIISFGADFWDVSLSDRINSIPEQVAFANPTAYESLFTVAKDPNTGVETLTFLSVPSNLGKAHYQGIDFDAISKAKTPIGNLTTRLAGTYMIKADYEIPGIDGYQSSMGQYGPDQTVTFRWQASISASLETGPFTNTLALTLKPGYRDAPITEDSGSVGVLNPDGSFGANVAVNRTVSSYTLVDWQTKYVFDKAWSITGGIKNLFNTSPPFSLQSAGGGNQIGYDGRYADPLGRQFYLTAAYKF